MQDWLGVFTVDFGVIRVHEPFHKSHQSFRARKLHGGRTIKFGDTACELGFEAVGDLGWWLN